jgi:predicted dehydrogenase
MRGWVDSIRSKAPIVAPVSDALTVARIVDACYRSETKRGAQIEVGAT